jgi:group I intron endonuclease|nr:MAG TPA: intron associated endonuclease [Caudoviricetes sp.]
MRTYYIYKATNKINGKSYVGQTCDFHSRVWQHQRCYEKEDCDFHRAIKKFGFDNFSWEIIETCESEDRACELEKYYIEKFNTYRDGYNMTKGGKGAPYHNARTVVLLTLDGKYVKRYDSAMDAEIDGFHNADVLLNCKGKRRQTKGYMFMFEDEYESNGAKTYRKPEPNGMRSIIQCDMEGNFIQKFKSLQEAARITGTNRTTISGVLSNTYKSANGYIFVYEEDFPIKDLSIYKKRKKGRKIAQVDAKSGEIVRVFDRISEAGESLGVNYKAIHKVIDQEGRTAYGYKWISQ